MMRFVKLVKKVGLRKGIKLKKDAFRNLSAELESVFYRYLDDIDLSKCDRITVSQYSSNLVIVECYRLNGYEDRYLITRTGADESILNGVSKWK